MGIRAIWYMDVSADCDMDIREAGVSMSGYRMPKGAVRASALSIDGLSFTYPEATDPLLKEVSLELEAGAFGLLVGDTGSGKSTLLSLMKPQIAPAGEREGSIRVFGESIDDMDSRDSAQAVGFVFQDPDSQLVCETVWHEMAFGLENLGLEQGVMRCRVAEASYFFGMGEWLHHAIDELSGGRKQLLALASTMVMRPKVLLLDEPTAQLDPVSARMLLHGLFRVNRELGCTVLIATHDPQVMVDYATCAYRLEEGRVRPVFDLEGLRAPLKRPYLQDAATSRPCRMPSGTAVTLSRLWLRYARDAAWVLRDLDVDIMKGEIHAFVGGNGCGKSTLLKVMAGVCVPQRGRAHVPIRAKALLPQNPCMLFVAETVYGELAEWSEQAGYGELEIGEMLARLNLEGQVDVHPYDLSGGQRQLLGLGKLLLLRPGLLLLDEPTKGLDPRSRLLFAQLLAQERAAGTTVILASHDLEVVSWVADTVSMVFDGQIACTVPVGDFFADNFLFKV